MDVSDASINADGTWGKGCCILIVFVKEVLCHPLPCKSTAFPIQLNPKLRCRFRDCPLPRMDEMPAGIGEMGIPPIAPVAANAAFAATGKRVGNIPILPEDLRA